MAQLNPFIISEITRPFLKGVEPLKVSENALHKVSSSMLKLPRALHVYADIYADDGNIVLR